MNMVHHGAIHQPSTTLPTAKRADCARLCSEAVDHVRLGWPSPKGSSTPLPEENTSRRWADEQILLEQSTACPAASAEFGGRGHESCMT